ncbi:outer membrane protein assembly factor BamB family protein [Lederbergia panacisoli]|uniref:outer membrane protein assembly factor BamB family protein n=1 Tax=Lederbergia panacisoli TaxID=1255251 RepID=UPI00214BA531|nr:PQQ-binding-like beta-propeller repeat protein [Lederbergia panacisoli]MCR2823273.1 hypothetical protein [Lederbergia panacisoli]
MFGPYMNESGYTTVNYYQKPTSLNNSILVYNSQGKKVYEKANDASLGTVSQVLANKNGIIINSQKGLKKINLKGKVEWSNKNLLNGGLFTTKNGDLFFSDQSRKKINKINPKNGKILWTYKLNTKDEINNLEINPKNGNFYFVTNKNVFVMNNKKLRWKVTAPKGHGIQEIILSPNGTAAIEMYNKKGYYLKVYSNKGKLKWQNKSKDFYISSGIFNKNDDFCMIDGSNQIIWFSSKGKIISLFKLNENNYLAPQIFSATNPRSIYVRYFQRDANFRSTYYIRKFNKNGKVLAQSKTKDFDFNTYTSGVYSLTHKKGAFQFKYYTLK